ncbi:hypothetical protein [Quadrisphaera sp. DSM 44207]|uniref:hypothetical protein n=1 Tax=Quadrisphaera sp. DSM 44207 TaxID=1881057 RepID=UPI00088170CC|nr:hypothetical protein [Quadrisphaera sp. DSM 44207]SDQ22557.1 hypothetical protein SAMN05428996_1170 [Quadrisphaera sp. DSM 44207]
MVRSRPRTARAAGALAALLALAACTGDGSDAAGSPSGGDAAAQQADDAPRAQLLAPAEGSQVLAADGPPESALAVSRALFERAPAAVLAGADDLAAQARAAPVAVALGVPLLLVPSGEAASADAAGGLGEELERLGASTLVTAGEPAAQWARGRDGAEVVALPQDDAALAELLGDAAGEPAAVDAAGATAAVAALEREAPALLRLEPAAGTGEAGAAGGAGGTEEDAAAQLPPVARAEPLDGVTVLAQPEQEDLAAAATARAAGARVLLAPGADPRADPGVVQALAGSPAATALGVGSAFGPPELLAQRLAVAAGGLELPGGGQVLFPGRRLVALYGHPGAPALGVLGEQGLEATLARAADVADDYDPHSAEPVVPALEVITTVASSSPGADGDYSAEATVEDLRPWVEAAGEAGTYVVLDLQPGTTDFLTQARRYEELLALPHVGLALDPEWRLEPGQRHMAQIGSVGADEVNSVVTWLADLTAQRALPQKLLLLHQFRMSMLGERERIDTSRDELSVLVQMDGHGSPDLKMGTWRTMTAEPPPGMRFGWKNFYDEDTPTFTPEETLQVEPAPWFVSYQ